MTSSFSLKFSVPKFFKPSRCTSTPLPKTKSKSTAFTIRPRYSAINVEPTQINLPTCSQFKVRTNPKLYIQPFPWHLCYFTHFKFNLAENLRAFWYCVY